MTRQTTNMRWICCTFWVITNHVIDVLCRWRRVCKRNIYPKRK